jgi:putative membrane-bound dehydrogenase-like protein
MLTVLFFALAQTPEPLRNANGPFEPAEAVKHLFVPPGFKVTPVAHEPAIVDPVCMCFDAKGRIFVCEMPGYPNGGRALGEETRGKIKMLEDKDGDGFFETVTLFADGLRFPTGITPYKDGMIVCNAPDIIYLKDTNGDGKADLKEVWYTGFDLANIQQLPNSLQWGLDNRIWGMVAGTGGIISCPKKPDMKPVNLRGKAFRFDPATPGSFEPTSGGGQYGLCRDAAGTWFTCSNGNCVRQIVLPEELASRNPDYVPPAVTADIDVEGTSIKVFRKSPFEAWRVERTTRRREGDDNKKYIPTELVPGGFTSSACGCIVIRDYFPAVSSRDYFVACDPGNNLIFRRALTRQPKSLLYQSSRPKEDRESELLASDDNWFRPVSLYHGPDDAIYICDFYREVIETPLSIPDDMKKRLNVESRSRGRIWRLSHADFKPLPLRNWTEATEDELRKRMKDENPYLRTVSARLLAERLNWPTVNPDATFLRLPLDLGISVSDVLSHPTGVMVVANQCINRGYANDPWFQDALLCSLGYDEITLLINNLKINPTFLAKLTNLIGRKNRPSDLANVLILLAYGKIDPIALSSLGRGIQSKGGSLAKLLADPPAECKEAVAKLHIRFTEAAQKSDESSLRLLAFAPFDLAKPALVRTFTLDTPSAIQQEAVRSLGQHSDPSIPALLLEKWNGFSPAVRKEVQDVLMSKPDRTLALLAALEKGAVKAGELDPARVQQLRNHPNANVRSKAVAILKSSIPADRQKVLADYNDIIDLKGDVAKGKVVFQNQCVSCHKLDGIGNDVGPNLLATLTGKSTRDLMTAILDPNREVDTRFLSYTATLNDGRVLTGIVASESANGLTLRQADGKEDSILRSDLESLKSGGQSLMPEGLEKQIDKQALADLIAFLKQPRN